MSRREFDPATDSEADGEEEEVVHHSTESGDDDEIQNEETTTGGKKKRVKLAPKDFVEMERWDWMEMSDSDILAHIRRHLFQFNQDAGIIHVPGPHRDSNDKYGDWVHRLSWTTKKGVVSNTILDCPYRKRCGCLCQSKIVEMPQRQYCLSQTCTLPKSMAIPRIKPSFSSSNTKSSFARTSECVPTKQPRN